MEFNFNNSAAPNRTVIPEFNFDLPKQQQQIPFETSFNINKVNAVNSASSNFNLNASNNFNNSNFNASNNFNNFNNNPSINKFNNFNINTFDKNLTGNNLQPNAAGNFGSKPYEDLSKKQHQYDFNFSNLLQNDNFKKQDDDFDPSNIKKQIRGAIIVIKLFKYFLIFI
jgi:hypothetical protein